MALKIFKTDHNKVFGVGGRTNEMVINSSRNSMHMPNIGATGEPIFLTLNTKKIFNYLELAFIKAVIL